MPPTAPAVHTRCAESLAYLFLGDIRGLRRKGVDELNGAGDTLRGHQARNVAELLGQALRQQHQVILAHGHEGDEVGVVKVEDVGVVVCRDQFLAVLHLRDRVYPHERIRNEKRVSVSLGRNVDTRSRLLISSSATKVTILLAVNLRSLFGDQLSDRVILAAGYS